MYEDNSDRYESRLPVWAKILIALAVVAALGISLYFIVRNSVLPYGAEIAVTPESTASEAPTPEPTAVPAPTPVPETNTTLQRSSYSVLLDIFPETMTASGQLELEYLNDTGSVVYAVKLRLYPNAIAGDSISVEAVMLNGESAYFTYGEDDTTVVSIPVAPELAPGESCTIYMEYYMRIPVSNERFGANEDGSMISFGNALPIVAANVDGDWRIDPYSFTGDAFVSDIADYRVIVSCPNEYALLSTGKVLDSQHDGNRISYQMDAPYVREFAFSLLKGASVASGSYEGIQVYSMAKSGDSAQRAVDAAIAALGFMTERVGSYPYETLCIAPMTMSGGMEYPGFITVNDEYYRSAYSDQFETVVYHEVVHQWFYAVVGSDQVMEPWVDESITEYLGFMIFKANNTPHDFDTLWQNEFSNVSDYRRTVRMDASLQAFEAAPVNEYYYTVYARGALMYEALCAELGEDVFYGALGQYYNAHRFSRTDGTELIEAFSDLAGRDMTQWFSDWFGVAE